MSLFPPNSRAAHLNTLNLQQQQKYILSIQNTWDLSDLCEHVGIKDHKRIIGLGMDITIDMYHVILFVYYGLDISDKYYTSLIHLLSWEFCFKYPAQDTFRLMAAFMTPNLADKLAKKFIKKLNEYASRNDTERYYRFIYIAFKVGLFIVDENTNAYAILPFILGLSQWKSLLQWYKNNNFQVSMSEISKYVSKFTNNNNQQFSKKYQNIQNKKMQHPSWKLENNMKQILGTKGISHYNFEEPQAQPSQWIKKVKSRTQHSSGISIINEEEEEEGEEEEEEEPVIEEDREHKSENDDDDEDYKPSKLQLHNLGNRTPPRTRSKNKLITSQSQGDNNSNNNNNNNNNNSSTNNNTNNKINSNTNHNICNINNNNNNNNNSNNINNINNIKTISNNDNINNSLINNKHKNNQNNSHNSVLESIIPSIEPKEKQEKYRASKIEGISDELSQYKQKTEEQDKQLDELRSLLHSVLDYQKKQQTGSSKKTDEIEFNFSKSNIIENKHQQKLQELNNDIRFDETHYLSPSPRYNDHNSSKRYHKHSKQQINKKYHEKESLFSFSKHSKKHMISHNNGFSSSSSDSEYKPDDNRLHTPKKKKSLKKYKTKKYEKNSIEYFRDRENPKYQTAELTSEEDTDDEHVAKYDEDGLRIGYIFNIGTRDKYYLRYDRLMEPKYIERLNLNVNSLIKDIKKDELLKVYEKINVRYEDNDKYPTNKMMNQIKTNITRCAGLTSLSDVYMTSFYKAQKSRIFLLNKIINPGVLDINYYIKYTLNIRYLELERLMTVYKSTRKEYCKIYNEYNKVNNPSRLLKKSVRLLEQNVKSILSSINKTIALLDHDLKLNAKIDKLLRAIHILMHKDEAYVEEEVTSYLNKNKGSNGKLVHLSHETLKDKKIQDNKSQTLLTSTSISSRPYVAPKQAISYDPQLSRVSNNMFKRKKSKYNSSYNGNYDYSYYDDGYSYSGYNNNYYQTNGKFYSNNKKWYNNNNRSKNNWRNNSHYQPKNNQEKSKEVPRIPVGPDNRNLEKKN